MSTGYVLLNRDKVSNNYVYNKIKKILHAVLLWSLLISMASLFVQITRNQVNLQSILLLPKCFLGLIQRGCLWHFWYLGALIIIYLIYPLLMRYRERLPLIWIISVTIGVAIQLISYFIGVPIQSYIIQTFRIWSWLQYFVLGGLIGNNYFKQKYIVNRTVTCILLTTLIVVYQNIMGQYFLHDSHAEYFYDSILTVIWLITIFDLLLGLNLNKANRLVQNIAPVTMGVYIIHPLIMMVIQNFMVIDSIGMSFVFFLAVLIISAICSFIMKRVPFVKRLIEL